MSEFEGKQTKRSKPTINVPTGREVDQPEEKAKAKIVKNSPPLTPGGLVRNVPPKEGE